MTLTTHLHALPRWALMTVLAVLPLYAAAGRPLQTEDAGVLAARTCELEGVAQGLRETGAPRSTQRGLQVACGVSGATQLSLAIDRTASAGAGEPGLRLGGKTEVWSGGDDAAALTLAYGLSGLRPAGRSWTRDVADVRAVVSAPAAGLQWHLNLGHERALQDKASTTVWGVAAEHPGVGALAPMAEIFGDDRGAPWWNLGLRWTIREDKAYADLSYGRQMVGGRPRLLTAGFKIVF